MVPVIFKKIVKTCVFPHRLLSSLAFLFSFRVQSLVDMAEKFPVQEQVDDQEGSKYQARIIMHGDPLVFGYPKVGYPATAPPATFRKYKIEYKPGNKWWYEHDKAADVYKCVDGNAFHLGYLISGFQD